MADPAAPGSARLRSLALLAGFALALTASAARADDAPPRPSASAGAGTAATPAAMAAMATWETWPSGRPFVNDVSRPRAAGTRVCSFQWPVCVHDQKGATGQRALATLAIAEEAMTMLTAQARLPMPQADAGGGTPAFDLYLADTAGRPMRAGFELPTRYPADRAPAFALVDARLRPGCPERVAVYRAVATGMLAAVDAGAEGGAFASTASYLAAVGTGCMASVLDAIEDAQANPERAIVYATDPDDERVPVILPWYLDEGFGGGAPGSLLTALWYGGQDSTPIEATRYHNRVDFMEILKRVAKAKEKKLDDVLLNLAVTRAFLGEREDGQHLPETAHWGRFGRPRFDASWTYESLPRRVAFSPLSPTGSTYVWIDLQKTRPLPRLALRAEWESPVMMRWSLVRVGLRGEEVSRLDVTSEKGVYRVEREIFQLEKLSGLLIVGVNMGEVGALHPFRVEEAPYEPHGGTVYVVADP